MILAATLLVCILVLSGILLYWSYPGKPKPFLDKSSNPLPGSISEKTYVQINGIRQGMIIRGQDQTLPTISLILGILSIVLSCCYGGLPLGLAAAITGYPRTHRAGLGALEGRVIVDGKELPYDKFSSIFANTTGVINPFIKPFVGDRTRDSFHFLAYAVPPREFAVMAPLLARAQLPIDPRALLRPESVWRQALLSLAGRVSL